MTKPKKKMFEVEVNETISDCLNRMAKEGYQPVRRIEKPIFQEVKDGGTTNYQPIAQQIQFEARIIE